MILGACVHGKRMRFKECFKDKKKKKSSRMERIWERIEVEYIFHMIRER